MAYEKILTRYNIPVTIGPVIGEITGASGKLERNLIKTLQNIFALPNVEPASHGWAHPFIWNIAKRKMGIKVKGYEYSPQNEIGNSLDYINDKLAPKDKKANIFLWTGDCLPDYDALKYVDEHGIKNLNGGDTRFDDEYPSYTYVAPLFRHVNDLLQYYSPNTNENLYTNLWTGPFYGFRYVIDTFKRTESPIRVRPIDVYYHFYSMEYYTSLNSLQTVYSWVLDQEIAPVFASDYIAAVDGFLSTKIDEVSKGHWIITDNGKIRSFRIDNYTGSVDMGRSKGVLGFLNYQDNLYVHLDNRETSEIILTTNRQSQPYLAKANGSVDNWEQSQGEIQFRLRIMERVHFAIGGMVGNRNYKVSIGDNKFETKSDSNGMLVFFHEFKETPFAWINYFEKNSLKDKKRFLPGNKFEWVGITVKL
jgi:hypothetical protein